MALQMIKPPQAAKQVAGLSRGSGSAGTGALPPLLEDPINILIVDDEPKNLMVLESILENPAYRLVRAESADSALLALVEQEFALIIMDIRLPDMSGFELTKLIKDRRKTASIPIIFLTAYYNEDQDVLEGYDTGAVDYLRKPVNQNVLRSKVAIFAEMHRSSRELGIANRALLTEVTERRHAQTQLRELNETLERRVAERTAELTERARVERVAREQLRASEEFNRSLMESTVDCVKVLDLDGRLLHINGPGVALFELDDASEVVGKFWADMWPLPAQHTVTSSLDIARAGGVGSFTEMLPTAKGTVKWWNVSVSPVRDFSTGEVNRLLAVTRDVTAARQIEQALRESDLKKDRFIATLAHELRNPLAPISNAVNVMRGVDAMDAQLAWCRDVIERQVAQMAHLLEDLLDVSRITQTKLVLRRTTLNVKEIMERAIEIASPLINDAGQTFTVTFPNDALYVSGDLTRLAQVLSNLLINASKYTAARGTVTLSAQRDGEEAVLTVTDSGIGIAPENLPRIFEMFGQVEQDVLHSKGGLGVGLSLAKGLAELHGGRLLARSDGPGQGSEFAVRLPLTIKDLVADTKQNNATAARACAHCRVLVADDSRDSADSLGLLLEAMGNEVRVAYTGEETVRLAEEFRPDIAFVDLGMPAVDGYEVCRRIRSHPWGKSMMIVAQTGWGQDEDRKQTTAAGFDFHLVKPVDHESVVRLIQNRKQFAGRES